MNVLFNELIYFLDPLPKSRKDCTIEVSRSHRLRYAVKWVYLNDTDHETVKIMTFKKYAVFQRAVSAGRACTKAKYQIAHVLYVMIMFNIDLKYYMAILI